MQQLFGTHATPFLVFIFSYARPVSIVVVPGACAPGRDSFGDKKSNGRIQGNNNRALNSTASAVRNDGATKKHAEKKENARTLQERQPAIEEKQFFFFFFLPPPFRPRQSLDVDALDAWKVAKGDVE